MVQNLADAGHKLVVYDANPATTAAVAHSVGAEPASSPADVVRKLGSSAAVISMVPNDKALWAVVKGEDGIFEATAKGSGLLHISCSTVSPFTSRALSDECEAAGVVHVSAPAFARPDGIAKRQAYFPISGGDTVARSASIELIGTTSPETFDFGDDPGAANVVKLSGNYLIASSIQSIAEAMALAEKNGLDRVQVMNMLSSTIFDCLIYKGYGQRVSERDHKPGGFALELGLKDVALVKDTAARSGVPMPVASVLHDRWLAAYAKGRGEVDWSAVALSTSEDSGVDVSAALAKAMRAVEEEKAAR